MKLAFVVQRYGPSINGGAELHARYIAERLAKHAEVEVLTTCATDYVTWRNELPAGVESLNGVAVRRFPVTRERDPLTFGRLSERVFGQAHTVRDELAWLDEEGPTCPSLISHLRAHGRDFDHFVFFSYRYYHAYHGIRCVSDRAVLVPTAERDATIGLSIFAPIFKGVRALMYNSPEERAMIRGIADNASVPSVVVGVGSEVPPHPQPARFRQKHRVRGPYAVYVGRIDENKGCRELFTHFQSYVREGIGQLTLVLVGHSLLDIPSHPRIRHVGFVDDQDKFDAIAGAELLIMPSFFESLSMVALEAWALGKPVLANGQCDVLKGQCLRSSAGLYYNDEAEFVEGLKAIELNKWLAGSLGRSGRLFYRDHYDWPVIETKYLEMLNRLSAAPAMSTLPPLEGWLDRRRVLVPAARETLARLPAGPSLDEEPVVRVPAKTVAAPPVPSRHERPAPASRWRVRRSPQANHRPHRGAPKR